jgi:hypothetical protein
VTTSVPKVEFTSSPVKDKLLSPDKAREPIAKSI